MNIMDITSNLVLDKTSNYIQEVKHLELLKQNLEEHFKFEIPKYIVMDMIDNEDYQHFCLMVNVAVINNRLSKEDGTVLKNEIKEIAGINSEYDKLDKDRIKEHFKV